MKPDGDLQYTISRNGKTRLQRWLFFSATPNSVPSTALSNAGPARLLWTTAEVNALPCTRIKPLVINTARFEANTTILGKARSDEKVKTRSPRKATLNLSDPRKGGCCSSPRDTDCSSFVCEVNCIGNRVRFCEGGGEATNKAVSSPGRVDSIDLVTLGLIFFIRAAENSSARAQGCDYRQRSMLA